MYRERRFSADQITALERVRFPWNPQDNFIESTVYHLRAFQKQFGHLDVPPDYVTTHDIPFPLRK